ncbi:hypothetical protein GCM10020256_34120 [Streptomyces thermocoprophilus]
MLGELSAEQLGYGDPRGVPELRRAVAGWVARNRGVRVAPDEVLIVSGTAQALTLLHPVLRAEGVDAVAVEDPGSLGSRQHLQAGGLATPGVPVDEDGVRVDALRATGARAVLLAPAHQFPTGVVLSGERRRELLAWARDGGLILEDDYDAEHRYDRPPVPALRGLLAAGVCYLGSVSKLLAPALRIGWMVPPPRHRVALTDAKRFADLGNPVLPQLVLARLMDSGELERHLRTLRRRHRARRDAMIAALAVHLPGGRGARGVGGAASDGDVRGGRTGSRAGRRRARPWREVSAAVLAPAAARPARTRPRLREQPTRGHRRGGRRPGGSAAGAVPLSRDAAAGRAGLVGRGAEPGSRAGGRAGESGRGVEPGAEPGSRAEESGRGPGRGAEPRSRAEESGRGAEPRSRAGGGAHSAVRT